MFRKITLFILLVLALAVQADQRHFVWTYEYMTMPKHQTELELYQTSKVSDAQSSELRLEIEHGITDKLDFALYQIFKQTETGPLSWDAFQIRTRYRFGEYGQNVIDPLLYLEYNRKLDLKKTNKVEAKLILAKTFQNYTVSASPVYEAFFAPGLEHEIGLDAGLALLKKSRFSIGLESVTRVEFEDSETELATYFGPTVSYRSGKSWLAVGGLAGLNDDADNARFRFILGVYL